MMEEPKYRRDKFLGKFIIRTTSEYGEMMNKLGGNIFDATIIEEFHPALLFTDSETLYDTIVYWMDYYNDDDLNYMSYNIDELEFEDDNLLPEDLIKLRKERIIKEVVQ